MTSPGTRTAGDTATAGSVPSADTVGLQVLRKRADFLKAAKAARRSTPGFNIQARKRGADEVRIGIFVGYTCSKKVGNAVVRNRAKRRLREIARKVLPEHGRFGWDYVLVGRANYTAARPFDEMCADLKSALNKLHPHQP